MEGQTELPLLQMPASAKAILGVRSRAEWFPGICNPNWKNANDQKLWSLCCNLLRNRRTEPRISSNDEDGHNLCPFRIDDG
jgi:hypothetical protein